MMHKFWVLIPLLLPLVGCNNDDLNRLLNSSSASADSTPPQRQYYGAQGSITQAEAPVLAGLVQPGSQPDSSGLYHFAQPQSRRAITSRIGYEDFYQGNSSYYKLNNGGAAEIIYNSAGQAIGLRQQGGAN